MDGVEPAMRAAVAGLSSPSVEVTAQSLRTLGHLADQGTPELRSYVFSVIAPMARWSSGLDGRIATELVRSLGLTEQPAAVRLLADFVAHESADARRELSGALASVWSALSTDDARTARSLLLRLVEDDDGEVRSWALFNLGAQVDADGRAVRDVLVAHLDDVDDDAADEALFGLARRRDPRALELVLARIELGSWSGRFLLAAGFLGSPRFVPALLARKAVGEDVDALLDRCDPVRVAERHEQHVQLLAALEVSMRHERPRIYSTRCELEVVLAIDSFAAGTVVEADRLLAVSGGRVGAAIARLRDVALIAKTSA